MTPSRCSTANAVVGSQSDQFSSNSGARRRAQPRPRPTSWRVMRKDSKATRRVRLAFDCLARGLTDYLRGV
jgi:hypothetical protein